MLFNSLAFAIFLPVVLAGYYLLRGSHKGQNRLLLAASLFFYACWDWRFLSLLFITMIVDFYVAAHLEDLHERGAPDGRRRRVLAISMFCNLAMLGFFKYCNFFIGSMQTLLTALHVPVHTHLLSIVLPVGISFFTFQSMSYTIDVYRGELKPTRDFWDFALFVSFFPHLVAGPIMRAVDLLPQITHPRSVSREQISDGIHLIIWGLWKKVFVADGLAPLVNATFGTPVASGFDTWTAVLAFAFQIYCDFSGYTDIARGVAKLMGFELTLNFNLPYFSRNPQEFWTRWHISLSNWLRNYLYIPLGGNRHGAFGTYRNLMLTMVIGGLWHGAAWNFVLWGAYQGLLLVVHRYASRHWPAALHVRQPSAAITALKIIVMFQFTCYGWLLFRANSLRQVIDMTAALTHPFDTVDWSRLEHIAVFAAPLVLVQWYQYVSGELLFLRLRWLPPELKSSCYAVLMYFVIFHAAAPQAFIYFQF